MRSYARYVLKQLERLPQRWRFSFLAAVLACLVIYGLEHVVESLLRESEEPGRSPLARSIFELSGLYQGAVTIGWRKPEPRFTAIVELNVENDPGLQAVSVNMVCDQRAFLAALIEKLTPVSPAVIVLDKYFGRDTCVRRPEGTVALQRAIESASKAGIPVVVGLYAARRESAAHRQGVGVGLDPSLFGDSSSVEHGIVNIDHDSRRMALRWCGGVDSRGATHPDWCETLALRAARKYDRQIMVKYPRLRSLMQEDRHPYISFMRPEQFCRYAVLGDGSFARRSDRRCPVDPDGALSVEYMRGKVVIVGETSRDIDTHFSVVGPVSGVFMQANYVEALLDDRYFKPVPVLDYLFGVSLFLGVTLLSAKLHDRPGLALLLIMLSVTTLIGLVVGLILLGGLYVNPLGVSVLALLFDGSHIALSWVFGKSAKHAAARGSG
jgi:CHASE2 domain-containing sensor protein